MGLDGIRAVIGANEMNRIDFEIVHQYRGDRLKNWWIGTTLACFCAYILCYADWSTFPGDKWARPLASVPLFRGPMTLSTIAVMAGAATLHWHGTYTRPTLKTTLLYAWLMAPLLAFVFGSPTFPLERFHPLQNWLCLLFLCGAQAFAFHRVSLIHWKCYQWLHSPEALIP